ncbi:MAG TPA: SpoIID/LytB domain-containing protein [Thermoanaerobaculia bacterium]|jgi:stage II sporulation protein D|nr:SpoIID/LytB domain-containing protein [Thermoanaerobaculia bacterium]
MRRSSFLLVLFAFLTACATTPAVPTTPIPIPTPTSTPSPARSPNALTPVSSGPRAIAEPRIRVGLLSDQSTIAFPRTTDGYFLVTDKGPSRLRRGFTATAPLANAPVRFAVQVSAISDQSSAQTLVEKIRTETGLRVDTVFDVANGQYKVIAGDFESSETATPARANLTERGYGKDLLIVRRPSDQTFEKRITIVDDEGDRATFDGPSLVVLPVTADTLVIDKQPYRSSARLVINARGLINVVNELNFEEYLYGVVPAEMGPSVYDEVEALKAQAVAARTYAFKNLRQFDSEGYDICPGPACQAYKGFAAEHELSTRAVRETAGLVVMMDGKPVDTLYTSTCGGETSDVATMFPGRNDRHLKHVKCTELEMLSLAGRADSGVLDEESVDGRIFAALANLPEPQSWSARDVAQATVAALRLAGWTEMNQPLPASSRRGDVLEYLAAITGIDEAGRTLTMPEDRRYYFPQTQNPDAVQYLVASFLTKYGIEPTQYIDRVSLAQPMPRLELYALLLSWVREHNVLSNAEGKILKLDGRRVTLKQKGETSAHTLPAGIPIFRRLGDRFQEYANVPILVGDRMTIVLSPGKVPVAAIVLANYDGASFDRTSSFANWTRSYRADELVPTINRRQPITQLVDIRPVTIDAAKRISELEVTAEGGRKFMLRGLPIRWSLNVPDNLFVYDKTRDADGVDRYTFYGKGWGHGTGMCQVGAYGMAFRGWTFDRILRHYYSGVDVAQMQ